MRTIIRKLLLPGLAVAAVLTTAIPAYASYADSSTGGCTARGQINVTGSLGWTETNAQAYGGCPYTYSQGDFEIGNFQYKLGPGWVSGSYAYSDTSAVGGTVAAIVGKHNLCSAGGTCPQPASAPWYTTY